MFAIKFDSFLAVLCMLALHMCQIDADESPGEDSGYCKTWNYDNASAWASTWPQCAGRRQSPINIELTNTQLITDPMPNLMFHGYNATPSNMTMVNTGNEEMAQLYTPAEVAKHDKPKDLWMTLHGGVYNLTDFLQQHPGGEEVLLNLAGKDGTVCFDEVGHTDEAVQLCETHKIGEVKGGPSGDPSGEAIPSSAAKREPSVDDDDWVYDEGPKKKMSPHVPLIVGVGVVCYAAILSYFFHY